MLFRVPGTRALPALAPSLVPALLLERGAFRTLNTLQKRTGILLQLAELGHSFCCAVPLLHTQQVASTIQLCSGCFSPALEVAHLCLQVANHGLAHRLSTVLHPAMLPAPHALADW